MWGIGCHLNKSGCQILYEDTKDLDVLRDKWNTQILKDMEEWKERVKLLDD